MILKNNIFKWIFIVAFVMLGLSLLVSGCSKNEKDNSKSLEQRKPTQEEINTGKVKLKIHKLMDMFRHYQSGNSNYIINQIKDINIEKNRSAFFDLYGENSGEILYTLNDLTQFEDGLYVSIDSIRIAIEKYNSDIKKLETKYARFISSDDFKTRYFMVEKKFPEPTTTGIYHSDIFKSYLAYTPSGETVALIGDLGDDIGRGFKEYFTVYKTEREYLFRVSKGYKSWEEKRKVKFYKIISNTLKPNNIRKAIEKLRSTKKKWNSQLDETEKKLSQALEKKVKKCKQIIISKIEEKDIEEVEKTGPTTLDLQKTPPAYRKGTTPKFVVHDSEPIPLPGNPSPQYTYFARQSGLEGTVMLRTEIFEDGTVGAVEVVKSLQSGEAVLDQQAIEAVKQWKFIPAKNQGKPVAVWVTFPVNFEL